MNKILIIGRLTADPELNFTQSGNAVCRVTVATDRAYQAEGRKNTDFIRVVAWRGVAETLAKYMHKGSMVAVEGELHVDSYEDKEGVRRISPEILANRIKFLDYRAKGQKTPESVPEVPGVEVGYDPEDLPFEEDMEQADLPF